MRGMFYGCNSLKELNLTNFDITNVNDIGSMFNGCYSVKIECLEEFKDRIISY